MSIFDEIMERREFQERPPVLVDVGASGGLHPAWSRVAKYSVCVAFDADEREMRVDSQTTGAYRQLHIYNRAVTSDEEGAADFYLTKAPACSSTLPPNGEKLGAWEFAERFTVVRKGTIQTIRLETALRERKIERIDWIKIDSQGTDLRLFQSLGESRMRDVLVAEFEPAIMDSYRGEDKLWRLMACMDGLDFWMCDCEVKGSQRIRKSQLGALREAEQKYFIHLLKSAPGWAEVRYFNSFEGREFGLREYLLGWVCATILGHHGFALGLARSAKEIFRDGLCEELERESIRSIRRSYWNLPAYFPLLGRVYRRWRKENRHRSVDGPRASALPPGADPVIRGDARD